MNQLAAVTRESIDTARQNWNAPDNEFRHSLNQRVDRAIDRVKNLATNLSSNSQVQKLTHTAADLGRTLAEKTENAIHSAQSTSATWVDQLFSETYGETGSADVNAPMIQSGTRIGDRNQPFVGVIDIGFGIGEHGTQVVDSIQRVNARTPDWLGDGVGTGEWPTSLTQFVDAAKISGRGQAIVNLSFDLTQINPDGSTTTRTELTQAETAALQYAQQQGVLIVASSGNQGGTMSALGQASQRFNNIITVGAATGSQRADYSSYGAGLDLLAAGHAPQNNLTGTSLAAAQVTGAVAKTWNANPQLSATQVIQILESTAKDLDTLGWDNQTGFGLLDQSAAVDRAKTTLESGKISDSQPLDRPEQVLELEQAPQNKTWSSLNGAIPSERPDSTAVTVRPGDTLWGIAARELGKGDRWREITKANGTPFTDQESSRLQIGTTVYLPESGSTHSNPGTVPNTTVPGATATTQINQTGLNLVKEFEGLRLKAYQDPGGTWTIGYGHTGSDVSPGNAISESQAEALLRQDLKAAEAAVRKSVRVPLTANQFSALVSFTYNLGSGALASSTLLDRLNQQDYQGAAAEFSKWVYAKREKLSGLVRRREDEKQLFLTPVNSIAASVGGVIGANAGVSIGTANSSVPSDRAVIRPNPVSDLNSVLNQIKAIENTVPGDYDPYVAAQTLRRKTNDKYWGKMFNYAAGWWDNLPSFSSDPWSIIKNSIVSAVPVIGIPYNIVASSNKYPGDNASSTYAKPEALPLFAGEMQLENGIKLPVSHFLAALAFQFGAAPNVSSWDNTYAGDLGSAAGAMEHPDDWITSNGQAAEVAKEAIKQRSSLQEKLPIALNAKAPPNQMDADIVAHVVGDIVKSKEIKISEAISEVSKMSKRQIYDAFMTLEFGYKLSDLVDDPFIDGPFHNSVVETHLQGRVNDFASKYAKLQYVVGDSSSQEGETIPSQESVKLVANDFIQYMLDEANVLSRNDIATLKVYSYLRG